MMDLLILATAAVCLFAAVGAYVKYKDVFHPLIFIPPMCAFIYVYMPLKFIRTGELFTFLPENQIEFVQTVILLTLIAFFWGCFAGSKDQGGTRPAADPQTANPAMLTKGAYALGLIGLAAWAYSIGNAGGITGAFGQSYGAGWSDIGYIRDAVYLLIVALLLLMSPEVYRFRDRKWMLAVVAFAIPSILQGLLGARRGPTFIITVTLAMSWYLARRKRPSPLVLGGGGAALGFLMLFLVTNRGEIYLGSDFDLKADVSEVASKATEANEYIFGAGCMVATNHLGKFYWGKRYLAQIFVRPIPRQLWPNKYADFGVPELLQNAGVAPEGMESVTGWREIPGAAAAMVADLWVEFGWFEIPVAWMLGWAYGRAWRRAVLERGQWTTLYVVLAMLSIYLVTQSGEAVIFRLFILTIPSVWIWRKAQKQGPGVDSKVLIPAEQKA